MSQSVIPEEVKQFIAEHINSVSQLEVLLLLHANQESGYCAVDLERELGIHPEAAQRQMIDLRSRGLLALGEAPDSLYRYGPTSEELDRAVNGLAQAYRQQRLKVLSIIFSKPVDKVRLFAEAFRLRKD